jgi:2-keto-3-deoxy-L-rhamnonate aldolase RhmA
VFQQGARERFGAIFAQDMAPVGTFVNSVDAAVTAALACAGADFVIIDQEHSPNDVQSTLQHIRAAKMHDVVPIVRVPTNEPIHIQRALDSGALGVVVPKVSSAEDALRALAASRYQSGGRGMCPTVEGARWSVDGWPRHRDHSNSNVLVIPLIETADGVERIKEIAVIDGIDYFLLGFADLSQDMGIDRETHADVLTREWARVRDAVHAAGGRIGCAPNPGQAGEGADFWTIQNDFNLLITSAHSAYAPYRQ